MAADTVITWRTHKTDTGFAWRVYSFGYQVPEETLKEGVSRTRAIATTRAQRWCVYLKAQCRAVAA